jgi:hypothetical protein
MSVKAKFLVSLPTMECVDVPVSRSSNTTNTETGGRGCVSLETMETGDLPATDLTADDTGSDSDICSDADDIGNDADEFQIIR